MYGELILAGAFSPVAGVIFATASTAAGSSDFNLWTSLSSLGVTGIFAFLLVTGKLVPNSTVDYLRKDLAEAKDQLQRLVQRLMDDAIPAMKDQARAVEKLAEKKAGR